MAYATICQEKIKQQKKSSTYTSWNSSSDFCGVNTFNKLIIYKGKTSEEVSALTQVKTHLLQKLLFKIKGTLVIYTI